MVVADGSDGTLMLPLKLLERKCNLLPFRALFLSLCHRRRLLLGVAIEINRALAPVYDRRWQAKLSLSLSLADAMLTTVMRDDQSKHVCVNTAAEAAAAKNTSQ